ncbi:caspase family protein [Leeuwenhoekiella nanhaiensis]|uniref:Peptidase C14 caspase domain-containing protein n=1 Tax=Leeuwenhoekiella nanhaiensis TaxID=1655491 RepID=A0A2G1VNP1_9FLAO|nr:caspase family protein [Leeuwenhoekiella nanhaiensis]PHQ28388.1 hypothetical protein CJ305_14820 [Leeuwenhoekiella nanhaiensis]
MRCIKIISCWCLFLLATTGVFSQKQDIAYTPSGIESITAFDANAKSGMVAMAVYPNTEVLLYDMYTADVVFRISGNTYTATALSFDESGEQLLIHYPNKTEVWDLIAFEKKVSYATDLYAPRAFSFPNQSFVSQESQNLVFRDIDQALTQQTSFDGIVSRLEFTPDGRQLVVQGIGFLKALAVADLNRQTDYNLQHVNNFVLGEQQFVVQQRAPQSSSGSDVRLSFYNYQGQKTSESIQPEKAFQTFNAGMQLLTDQLLLYESFDKVFLINQQGGEEALEFDPGLEDFRFIRGLGFVLNFKKRLELRDLEGNLINRFYAKDFLSKGSFINPESGEVAVIIDSSLVLGNDTAKTPKQISLNSRLVNTVTGDGDALAFATHDGYLRYWNLKNQKERLAFAHKQKTAPQFLSLNISEQVIVAGFPRAHQVMAYDIKTGKERAVLQIPQDQHITALAFDGKQLVIATRTGNYAVYELQTQAFALKRDFTPALSNAITGISISHNKAALSSLGRIVKVILNREDTIENKDVIVGHSSFIHGIDYDKSGTYLATADVAGDMHFWDAEKGRLVHSIHLDSAWVKNLKLHDSLYVTSSGPGVLTANFYNPVVYKKITDPKPKLLVQSANTSAIRQVVFSRDGKLLASDDGSVIKVREVQTGFLISEFSTQNNTINDLDFLQDSATLVVASGKAVEFFDAYTGESRKFLDFKTRNRSIHQVKVFPNFNTVVGLNVHGWHYPLLIHSNSGLVVGTLDVNPEAEKDRQIINLIVSRDGKRIATYGNSYIKVFSVDEQLKLQQLTAYPRSAPDKSNTYWNDLMSFNASGNQLSFVEMDSPNKLKVLDVETGRITYETRGKLSVYGLNDELVGMVPGDVSLSYLEPGTTSWKFMFAEQEHINLISSLDYDPVNQLYASADSWGNLITWDAETKTPLWQIDRFENDIYNAELNATGDQMAFNTKSGIFIFDFKQFKMRKLEGNNYPYFGKFSKDGQLFYYRQANDYRVYRAANEADALLFTTPVSKDDASGSLLSDDGSVLSFKNKATSVLHSYDLKTKAALPVVNLNEVPGYFSLTPKSTTLDASGKLLLTGTGIKRTADSLIVFNKITYVPATRKLSVQSGDHSIDLKEQKGFLDYRIKYHSALDAYSQDGRYYAYLEDFHLKIEDLEAGEVVYDRYVKGLDIVNGLFAEDSKSLILGYENGSVEVLAVPDMKTVYSFAGSTSHITNLQVANRYLMVLGDDNLINVFDSQEGFKLLYSATFLKDGEFILSNPDGYYYASKEAREAVAFKKGDAVYPFEQFDLFYNRPDKAIDNLVHLGITDSLLQQGYEMAYEKRLFKMGFKEEGLSGDFELPVLELLTKDLPATTSEANLSFDVRATDKNHDLDRILVWINDVPVYGSKGRSVRAQNTRSLSENINLNLASGSNKVQVAVVNTSGVESLKKTFVINSTAPTPKPDLYVVSIGVSTYQDSGYSLKYAAKDSRDLIAYALENTAGYGKIHQHNLTDEQVTKVGITKLKDSLSQSRINDVVIVFFAGHGVLDAEMNYYLGTYDMDFENPQEKGLAYDGLENLLDGIPALNKLLIIDACHSGEVDQEETALAEQELTNSKVKAGKRGSIVVKSKSKQLGLENSFELMQLLFSDLRRGTGATVISSASGLEYAYEGEAWENGVFTYAMLEGLKSGNCDLNEDGAVQVSELKSYVFDKVSELTNGKQNPTSRKENLEYDFTVW